MLLYANYVPSAHNETSWNRPRIYAFASVERLVNAMRETDGCGMGTLKLITKEEAQYQSSIATLYTGIDEDGNAKQDGACIVVH